MSEVVFNDHETIIVESLASHSQPGFKEGDIVVSVNSIDVIDKGASLAMSTSQSTGRVDLRFAAFCPFLF